MNGFTVLFFSALSGIGLALSVTSESLESKPPPAIERACKVCKESCCPDARNCSCLHVDTCTCADPTAQEGP